MDAREAKQRSACPVQISSPSARPPGKLSDPPSPVSSPTRHLPRSEHSSSYLCVVLACPPRPPQPHASSHIADLRHASVYVASLPHTADAFYLLRHPPPCSVQPQSEAWRATTTNWTRSSSCCNSYASRMWATCKRPITRITGARLRSWTSGGSRQSMGGPWSLQPHPRSASSTTVSIRVPNTLSALMC